MGGAVLVKRNAVDSLVHGRIRRGWSILENNRADVTYFLSEWYGSFFLLYSLIANMSQQLTVSSESMRIYSSGLATNHFQSLLEKDS